MYMYVMYAPLCVPYDTTAGNVRTCYASIYVCMYIYTYIHSSSVIILKYVHTHFDNFEHGVSRHAFVYKYRG
jgi:hypothetical protein